MAAGLAGWLMPLTLLFSVLALALSIACIQAGVNGEMRDTDFAHVNFTQFGKGLVPKLKDKIINDPKLIEKWAKDNAGLIGGLIGKGIAVGANLDHNKQQQRDLDLGLELSALFGAGEETVTDEVQSRIGDAITDVLNGGDNKAGVTVGDIIGGLGGLAPLINKLKGDLTNTLDKLVSDSTKNIADSLGIPDYASLHLQTACMQKNLGNNVADVSCIKQKIGYNLDLSGYLAKNLTIASYQIPLTDVVGNDVKDKVAMADMLLQKFVTAFAVIYIIGACLLGLTMLLALLALLQMCRSGAVSKMLTLPGLLLSLLASLALLIGSVCATIGAKVARDKLAEQQVAGVSVADLLNIEIARGNRFLTLTWIAYASATISSIVWLLSMMMGRRAATGRKGGALGDKHHPRGPY